MKPDGKLVCFGIEHYGHCRVHPGRGPVVAVAAREEQNGAARSERSWRQEHAGKGRTAATHT